MIASYIKPGFPGSSVGKESACNAGDHLQSRRPGLIPGSVRSWGRKVQPTPVFLPGKSDGQRSLVGYRLARVVHINQTTIDFYFYLQTSLPFYDLY